MDNGQPRLFVDCRWRCLIQDYRVFVGAFPAGDAAAAIQAVRERHDPITARITPPHVTLAGTYWRSGPATVANETAAIAALHDLAGRIEPFELILGGIHTFPPADRPVIYLGVGRTSGLLAARQALLAALGPDKHGTHFIPHLTLAMRLGAERAASVLAELHRTAWLLEPFSVPINALQLMQRGPSDTAWRAIATLSLASTP